MASLGLAEVHFSQASELERLCLDGYRQGLAEAGWSGDHRLVRLGYTLATSLRYAALVPLTVTLPLLRNEARVDAVAQILGRSVDEVLEAFAFSIRYSLELGEEARGLIASDT
jgi:hypothetical protein